MISPTIPWWSIPTYRKDKQVGVFVDFILATKNFPIQALGICYVKLMYCHFQSRIYHSNC